MLFHIFGIISIFLRRHMAPQFFLVIFIYFIILCIDLCKFYSVFCGAARRHCFLVIFFCFIVPCDFVVCACVCILMLSVQFCAAPCGADIFELSFLFIVYLVILSSVLVNVY